MNTTPQNEPVFGSDLTLLDARQDKNRVEGGTLYLVATPKMALTVKKRMGHTRV